LYSMRPYVITVGLYVCLEHLSGWDLVIEIKKKKTLSVCLYPWISYRIFSAP